MRGFVSSVTQCVKIKFIGFIFCSYVGVYADAEVLLDQRAAVVGRSYPIGIQAGYSLGLNYGVWGETDRIQDSQTQNSKPQWKYGYIRLAMNAATSVVINRIGLEAQIFPISIFGIGVGHDWGFRSFRMPFADCGTYQCFGRVDRSYLRGQMIVGHAGVLLMMQARFDQLRHVGFGAPNFFDEVTLLSTRSPRERVMTLNPILLYAVTEDLRVGAISLYSRGIDSGDHSHLFGPVTQLQHTPKFSTIIGAGLNQASTVHSAFTLFFMLNYVISPSLSIADQGLRNTID